VTPLVGIAVELGREAAVGFGRDDRLNPRLRQRLDQPVRVESPVREELSAGQPFDQRRRAAQVVGLPRQQPEVDEVAERVRQCDDFGGHTAARAPDGLTLSFLLPGNRCLQR